MRRMANSPGLSQPKIFPPGLIGTWQNFSMTTKKPFIDVLHAQQTIAAYCLEFYWAGDQPGGGVRLRVQWTDFGRMLVEDRTYTRFSPEFTHIAGSVGAYGMNLGGLCNNPVFRNIQRLEDSRPLPPVAMLEPKIISGF